MRHQPTRPLEPPLSPFAWAPLRHDDLRGADNEYLPVAIPLPDPGSANDPDAACAVVARSQGVVVGRASAASQA